MGFNPQWEPSRLPNFEEAWTHAQLPASGNITPDEAERLMIIFQAMSDELGDLVANATYYEETCKYAYETELARAFRESTESSDRKREAQAQADRLVDMSKKVWMKAKAVRQYLDRKHDSAVRSHHAMKILVRNNQEEKWLERGT